MKESTCHETHEIDIANVFAVSGCKYFRGTKQIALWKGKEFHEELAKTIHTSMSFDTCACKKGITITLAQEWAMLPLSDSDSSH